MSKRRFAVVPSSSVLLHAEATGLSVSDPAASLLAEDVSYRLRDVTHAACELMKNSKRRKLTVEDFNRCFKLKNLEPHYGFGSNDSQPFKQVQYKGETLYFYDEKEVVLKEKMFENKQLQTASPPLIRVHWLGIEGNSSLHGSKKDRQSDGQELEKACQLDKAMNEYYTVLCKGVISSDEQVCQASLEELGTASSVAAILPHLVNFLTSVLPTFLQGPTESSEGLYSLVKTIRALASNKNVYLVPHLPDLVGLTMKCATDPRVKSCAKRSLDHWTIRDTAAQTTARLVKLTEIVDSDIQREILSSYSQYLDPSNTPLVSVYGAVVGIAAFGYKAIEKYFVPHFDAIQCGIELKEGVDVRVLREAIKRTVAALLRRSLTRETHTVVRETEFDDDDDDDDDDDSDTSPTSFDLYGSIYAVHGDGILSCIDSKWEWWRRREEETEEGEGSDSIVNESDSDASSDDDVPPPPTTVVRTTVNGEESREHFARDRDRCIGTSTGMDARDCEDARRDLKPKQLCFALKPKKRKFQRPSSHADRLFSYDDDDDE